MDGAGNPLPYSLEPLAADLSLFFSLDFPEAPEHSRHSVEQSDEAQSPLGHLIWKRDLWCACGLVCQPEVTGSESCELRQSSAGSPIRPASAGVSGDL